VCMCRLNVNSMAMLAPVKRIGTTHNGSLKRHTVSITRSELAARRYVLCGQQILLLILYQPVQWKVIIHCINMNIGIKRKLHDNNNSTNFANKIFPWYVSLLAIAFLIKCLGRLQVSTLLMFKILLFWEDALCNAGETSQRSKDGDHP
jgi:hypothetical protein